MKKPKSLTGLFTYPELNNYCNEHKEYRIPSIRDAEQFNTKDTIHDTFWTTDILSDRNVIYNKRKQCFRIAHPQTRHFAVLVRL